MGCVCCFQTPCVSLCRMPNEIFVEMELGSLTYDNFWNITQAEIDSIAAEIDGTYSLTPDIWGGSYQRYSYNRGSPYQFPTNSIRLIWYCNAGSPPFSVLYDLDFCYSGSTNEEKRNLITSPSTGINILDTVLPDITDYCSGTAFSASITGELRSHPDTQCGAQPGVFHRVAIFDLDLTFSV